MTTPYRVLNHLSNSAPTPEPTPYQVQNQMAAQHLQKSEALASEAVGEGSSQEMPDSGTSPNTSTHRPFLKSFSPFAAHSSTPSSSKFNLSLGTDQTGNTHPLNNVQSEPHPPSQQDAQEDSDASWVAETGDDEPGKKGNATSNSSEESWIAEDDGLPGPSNGPVEQHPVSRPVSISLAKKELSLLTTKDLPSIPPDTYLMGEGRPGVAERSSFLLTPGAEMTVQCVANPVYADRSPEVASTVTRTEASRPSAMSTRRTYGAPARPAATHSTIQSVHLSTATAPTATRTTPIATGTTATAPTATGGTSTAPTHTAPMPRLEMRQELVSEAGSKDRGQGIRTRGGSWSAVQYRHYSSGETLTIAGRSMISISLPAFCQTAACRLGMGIRNGIQFLAQ